jgi:hypothetical protein
MSVSSHGCDAFRDRPELVIDAIRAMLKEARERAGQFSLSQ